MASFRERFETGPGMRAQRLVEGILLTASFLLDDTRPAAVAFVMLAVQAIVSPLASPVALVWVLLDRRPTAPRLGNLYHDLTAVRGSAMVSTVVLAVALGLDRAGLPVARVLTAAPAASCLLSATVGFCAGCGIYVLLRDLAARRGLTPRPPRGASDVDVR